MNLKEIVAKLKLMTRDDDEALIHPQPRRIDALDQANSAAGHAEIAKQLETNVNFRVSESLKNNLLFVPRKNAIVKEIKMLEVLLLDQLRSIKDEIFEIMRAYHDNYNGDIYSITADDSQSEISVIQIIKQKLQPIWTLKKLNALYQMLKNGIPSSFYHDVVTKDDEERIDRFQRELMSNILYLIPDSQESWVLTKIPESRGTEEPARSVLTRGKIDELINQEKLDSERNVERIKHALSEIKTMSLEQSEVSAFAELSDLRDSNKRELYIKKDDQRLLQELDSLGVSDFSSQNRIIEIKDTIASHRGTLAQMEVFNQINFSQNSTEVNSSLDSSSDVITLVDINGNPYDYRRMQMVLTQNGVQVDSDSPITITDIYHMIEVINELTTSLRLEIEKLESEQAALESVETNRQATIKRIQIEIHRTKAENFEVILSLYQKLRDELRRKDSWLKTILNLIQDYAGDIISSEAIKLVNFAMQNVTDYVKGIDSVKEDEVNNKISEYCKDIADLTLVISHETHSVSRLGNQNILAYLDPEIFERLVTNILDKSTLYREWTRIAEHLSRELQNDIDMIPSLHPTAMVHLEREQFIVQPVDNCLESRFREIDTRTEFKRNLIISKNNEYGADKSNLSCCKDQDFIEEIETLNEEIQRLYKEYESYGTIKNVSMRKVKLDLSFIEASYFLEQVKRKWPRFIELYCQIKLDYVTNKSQELGRVIAIYDKFYSLCMKKNTVKDVIFETNVNSLTSQTIHEHIHALILNIENTNREKIALPQSQSPGSSIPQRTEDDVPEEIEALRAVAGPSGEAGPREISTDLGAQSESKSAFRIYYESSIAFIAREQTQDVASTQNVPKTENSVVRFKK